MPFSVDAGSFNPVSLAWPAFVSPEILVNLSWITQLVFIETKGLKVVFTCNFFDVWKNTAGELQQDPSHQCLLLLQDYEAFFQLLVGLHGSEGVQRRVYTLKQAEIVREQELVSEDGESQSWNICRLPLSLYKVAWIICNIPQRIHVESNRKPKWMVIL